MGFVILGCGATASFFSSGFFSFSFCSFFSSFFFLSAQLFVNGTVILIVFPSTTTVLVRILSYFSLTLSILVADCSNSFSLISRYLANGKRSEERQVHYRPSDFGEPC